MKVGIIGAGAYALALAHVLKKNNDVIIWTKLEDEYKELKLQPIEQSIKQLYTWYSNNIDSIDYSILKETR